MRSKKQKVVLLRNTPILFAQMNKYLCLDNKTNDLLSATQKEFVRRLANLLEQFSPPHVDPSKAKVSFDGPYGTFLTIIPHQKFGLSICTEQSLLDEITIYWVNNSWFWDDFNANPVCSFYILDDRWVDLAIKCISEQLTRPIYISDYYLKNKLVKTIYYLKNEDYSKIRTNLTNSSFFDFLRLKKVKKYVATFIDS